jgi:transcription initiation factor TFIIH subunit 1
MTTLISAATAFKKQNGTLSITSDRKTVLWTPSAPRGGPPTWQIATTDISAFQQSPASSAKASVKFLVQLPGSSTQEDYIFRFTSPTTAKEEKEAVIGALSEIVSALKKAAGQTSSRDAAPQSSSVSTPQALAASVELAKDPFSDSTYLNDIQLQKSLLSQDATLRHRFEESLGEMLKNNPKASLAQFQTQFWSSRVHLLRSHAVERSQVQGPYNVLSQIKKTQNNEGIVILNISKEQIALIFQQHPLTRKIYNSLVPNRLSEGDFWSKFFSSKLLKKLKGEKITDLDPNVPELDKYLNEDETQDQGEQFHIDKIPRFLDLDGNEQDHTETLGNAPDETMRPSQHDRVPILRVLNSMSEKLMANVAATDAEELYNPAGVDESKFEQLRLQDLRAQEDDNRVLLNVLSQQKFFSHDTIGVNDQSLVSDPDAVMAQLQAQISADSSLSINMDEGAKARASMSTSNILKTIRQRSSNFAAHEQQGATLPPQFVQSATMTHNTTIEFLHYFWDVYLSGDDSRAGELANLVETLDKSLKRMEAVAQDAEVERERKMKQIREKEREYQNRVGKRMRIDPKKAGGGGEVVRTMLNATERAVKFAEAEYQTAYNEQISQNATA